MEGSINTRFKMIQMGWNGLKNVRFLVTESIIIGFLLGEEVGRLLTLHNNIIELLVGIGLFGTIIYYLAHIIVIKDLYKCSKALPKSLTYSFIAIILGYMFMSVGLVYYDNKHISIILSIASIVHRIGKKEVNTLN